MFDERIRTLQPTRRGQRGSMLLEAMVATVILTIAFLAWSGSMMGASQGQYHAAKHTESIEIANYYLEQMRRDPYIFGTQEFLWPSCNGNNCWKQGAGNDPCGNAWPAYADAGPQNGGTWHTGCQNLTMETGATINEPYNFQWRADIHCKGGTGLNGGCSEDDNAADLTVWIETQTLHGGWDTYKVTGLKKAPRS